MFELVPSAWMRNHLKEKNRVFTDREKAALIWNSPSLLWREKLDALDELAAAADEEKLKKEIRERIWFEEEAYRRMGMNEKGQFVYILEDVVGNGYGYFRDYEQARHCVIKWTPEEECEFHIEKYHIAFTETLSQIEEYVADWSAIACFNRKGEMTHLYSNEMTDEEEGKISSQDFGRFESHFFQIPFGMEEGTIVKNVVDGNYGVLASGEKDWEDYMRQTEKNPSACDFGDIQTIVCVLRYDGVWSHQHINPMYLEPDLPEDSIHAVALKALSAFFKEKSKENDECALLASRKYAEQIESKQKKRRDSFLNFVYKAESIDDILC